MSASDGDHYAQLGVASTASAKEISKAFRARARKIHPDKLPPGASEAQKDRAKKEFQVLAKAYEVLSDPTRRARYDHDAAAAADAKAAGSRRSGAGAAGGYAHDREGARAYQWSRPQEPEPWEQQYEADVAAERQRREKEQREAARKDFERRSGLGAHWVKPPTVRAPEKWSGWEQSGAGSCDDGASDASSELSFGINLGADLNDVNLDDLEYFSDDDPELKAMETHGEVWRPQAFELKPQPGPLQAPQAAAKKDVGAKAASTASSRKEGSGPRCCVHQ